MKTPVGKQKNNDGSVSFHPAILVEACISPVRMDNGTDEKPEMQDVCSTIPFSDAVKCYLLSTALDFHEEEMMMQQSSVSISLSF